MKQTVTANVGGVAFHIDEDAYSTLSTYLHEIENHLHESDSKAEIMQDIEARVAELFKQHLNFSHLEVVNHTMVQDVINQLGRPEVISDGMDDSEETSTETTASSESQTEEPKPPFRKRLYRDIDNQFISGVCAGLGKYCGIDSIWFKLAFILLTGCNGVGLLAYIILWIIMQPADTAARRLEMQGIEPSAENIKAEVERMRVYQETHPYKPGRSTAGQIAYGCGIALLILILFPVAIVLFAIILGLGAALFGLGVGVAPIMSFLGLSMAEFSSSWLVILCMLLVFLIPIITFFVWLARRKKQPLKRGFWITMLVLWLLSFAGACISGIWFSNKVSNIDIHQAKERLENLTTQMEENAETWEQWADSLETAIDHKTDSIDAANTNLSETGVLEITGDTI